MRQISKAVLSALLALVVVALGGYLIGNYVTFQIPQQELSQTPFTLKVGCDNLEFLQEQVIKQIAQAKSCASDEDCDTIYLGCPFGCRTTINRKHIEPILAMAAAITDHCPTCPYMCRSGNYMDVCRAGQCRSLYFKEPEAPLFEAGTP